MKKLLPVFFLSLFLLVECKEDEVEDAKPATPEQLIEGKWENGYYELKEYQDWTVIHHEFQNRSEIMEFKDNKVYWINNRVKIERGVYTITNDGSKSILTIKSPNEQTEFELTVLTEKELTYVYREDTIINGQEFHKEEYFYCRRP